MRSGEGKGLAEGKGAPSVLQRERQPTGEAVARNKPEGFSCLGLRHRWEGDADIGTCLCQQTSNGCRGLTQGTGVSCLPGAAFWRWLTREDCAAHCLLGGESRESAMECSRPSVPPVWSGAGLSHFRQCPEMRFLFQTFLALSANAARLCRDPSHPRENNLGSLLCQWIWACRTALFLPRLPFPWENVLLVQFQPLEAQPGDQRESPETSPGMEGSCPHFHGRKRRPCS